MGRNQVGADLLGSLQLGEARQQPLDALAGERDRDLLVVLDQLGADDDALAEQRVAHLLPREEGGVARGSGPRLWALASAGLGGALRDDAPGPGAWAAEAAPGEHAGLLNR